MQSNNLDVPAKRSLIAVAVEQSKTSLNRWLQVGGLAGYLVAAPVSADIGEFLNQGVALLPAYMEASNECGGQCDDLIAAQLIALGYTTADVVSAVVASGGDIVAVLSSLTLAALANGMSITQVLPALLQLNGVAALDVVVGVTDAAAQDSSIAMDSLFAAALAAGISVDVLIAGVLSTGADVDVVIALAEQAGSSEADIDSGLELAVVLSGGEATAAGASQQAGSTAVENTTPVVTVTPSSTSET